MARFEIKMPKLGESITEGTILSWSVQIGDVVKGPLKGLEGELVEVDGKAKVVVRLDLLGCAGVDMPVRVLSRC